MSSHYSTKVLAGLNNDDDYITPLYALKDLFSYIHEGVQGSRIWEPFYGDGGSTEKIKKLGYNVIECRGKEFFTTPPPVGEDVVMVTNPPFSIKKEVLEQIIRVQKVKKFAILLPAQVLFAKYFKKLTEGMRIRVLLPNSRIQFLKGGEKTVRCPLDTAWIVHGIPFTKEPLPLEFDLLPLVGNNKKDI